MAFPTTSVLDNFNRANGDAGSNYTANGYNFGFVIPQISSNTLKRNSSGTSDAYWNVAQYGPDVEAYIDISTDLVSDDYGFSIRFINPVSANVSGYFLHIGASAADTTKIERVDNGAFTVLGSSVAQTWATGEKFGVSAVGSTLSVFRYTAGAWGAAYATRTDSTYTAAGYIDIYITGTTGRYDNFGGGTVVVAPVIPVFMNQYRQRAA